MEITIDTLTLTDFFMGIFPGSYFCCLTERGQINGEVPFEKLIHKTESEIIDWSQKWIDWNNEGLNIHFTPNGLKEGSLTNKKENFSHINAWWVDVDIEETKILSENLVERESQLILRQQGKNKILGKFFSSKLPLPSMLNETRNGYQAIWFAKNGSLKNFEKIQASLVYEFGGDKAASTPNSMLRVPDFKYYKKGETGIIAPQFTWSTCQLVEEADMLNRIKIEPVVVLPHVYQIQRAPQSNSGHGIWSQLDSIAVQYQIAKLSGHWLVNGETLSLKKTNIWANNQPTPCFVDLKANHIYSKNYSGMKSLLQFCQWYGHSKEVVTENLKLLFNLK